MPINNLEVTFIIIEIIIILFIFIVIMYKSHYVLFEFVSNNINLKNNERFLKTLFVSLNLYK